MFVCQSASLSVHVPHISVHLAIFVSPRSFMSPHLSFCSSMYPFCPSIWPYSCPCPFLSILPVSVSIHAPICLSHAFHLSILCSAPSVPLCPSICLEPSSRLYLPNCIPFTFPSLTLLHPPWPLCQFSNTPSLVPPQGLHTGCSLSVEYSSLRKPHSSSPTSFKSLLKQRHLLSDLLSGHSQHFPCFTFFP